MSKTKFVVTIFVSFFAYCADSFAVPSVRQLGTGAQKAPVKTVVDAPKASTNRAATPMVVKATSTATASTVKSATTPVKAATGSNRITGKPISLGKTGTQVKSSPTTTYLTEFDNRINTLNTNLASTKETLQAEIADAVADKLTSDQVQTKIETATADMVTTTNLDTELAKSEKITAMETSIGEKMTETQVNNKIETATAGMVTTTNLDTELAKSEKITAMETSIDEKMTETQVNNKIETATADMVTTTNLDTALDESKTIYHLNKVKNLFNADEEGALTLDQDKIKGLSAQMEDLDNIKTAFAIDKETGKLSGTIKQDSVAGLSNQMTDLNTIKGAFKKNNNNIITSTIKQNSVDGLSNKMAELDTVKAAFTTDDDGNLTSTIAQEKVAGLSDKMAELDTVKAAFTTDDDGNLTSTIAQEKVAGLSEKMTALQTITDALKLDDDENGYAAVKTKALSAVTSTELNNKFSSLDFDVIDEKLKFSTDGENWSEIAPISELGGTGASAYDIWLSKGNTGDEQAFLNSLKGADACPTTTEVEHEGCKRLKTTACDGTETYGNCLYQTCTTGEITGFTVDEKTGKTIVTKCGEKPAELCPRKDTVYDNTKHCYREAIIGCGKESEPTWIGTDCLSPVCPQIVEIYDENDKCYKKQTTNCKGEVSTGACETRPTCTTGQITGLSRDTATGELKITKCGGSTPTELCPKQGKAFDETAQCYKEALLDCDDDHVVKFIGDCLNPKMCPTTVEIYDENEKCYKKRTTNCKGEVSTGACETRPTCTTGQITGLSRDTATGELKITKCGGSTPTELCPKQGKAFDETAQCYKEALLDCDDDHVVKFIGDCLNPKMCPTTVEIYDENDKCYKKQTTNCKGEVSTGACETRPTCTDGDIVGVQLSSDNTSLEVTTCGNTNPDPTKKITLPASKKPVLKMGTGNNTSKMYLGYDDETDDKFVDVEERLIGTVPVANDDTIRRVLSGMSVYSKEEVNTELAKYQTLITNEAKLPAASISGLANVATSGNYEDLNGKPTIPTVPANIDKIAANFDANGDLDYDNLKNKPELFSGNYEDLKNTPTIPTVPANIDKIAANFDANGDLDYDNLKNKPELFSGNYEDLKNTPTIPQKLSELTNDKGFSCKTFEYNYASGAPSVTVTTLPSNFNNPNNYTTASSARGFVLETITDPCDDTFTPITNKTDDACGATYPVTVKTEDGKSTSYTYYTIHECLHQTATATSASSIPTTPYYWVEEVSGNSSIAYQINQAAATAGDAASAAQSAKAAAASVAQAVNGVDCTGVEGACTARAGLLAQFNAVVDAFLRAGILSGSCSDTQCSYQAQ